MAREPIATNGRKFIAPRRFDTARVAVAAFAALLMAIVARDVLTRGPLSELDAPALAWLSSARNVFLDHLLAWVSLSGGPSATSAYAAILIVAYLVRRLVRSALAIAAVVYGAVLLNVVLKDLWQRPRPPVKDEITTLPTFSFPSGHAVASTVFAGLVCLLVLRSGISRGRAAIAVGLAISWVALVCASRAYLGLHYPTDIVAGVCEGVCWLTLATVALDSLGIDMRWPRRAVGAP
ncbi:MAG: phosphatase PAP2 family protein [Casimicrobiaceae bacterium]